MTEQDENRLAWVLLVGVMALLVVLGDARAHDAGPSAKALVTSVYDGDTFRAKVQVWPGLSWEGSVRVAGLDTPELRSRNPKEKVLARAAREFAKRLVEGHTVELRNVRLGKYAGRVIADVFYRSQSLAKAVIGAGHGRAYDGGKRLPWGD